MAEVTSKSGEAGIPAPPFFRRVHELVQDPKSTFLYFYLLDSQYPFEGEWKVAGDLSTLTKESGVPRTTFYRRLSVLEELGLARKVKDGKRVAVLVRSIPREIAQEEDIVARKSRFTKIALGQGDDKIKQAIEGGIEKNRRKREYNENKPEYLRMPGQKNTDKAPKKHRPHQMIEFINDQILRNALSRVRVKNTDATKSKMKRLIEEQGAENVREVIEWVCKPKNWRKVKEKFDLDGIPNPGLLLGFSQSIFPMALDAEVESHRSGGVKARDGEYGDDINPAF